MIKKLILSAIGAGVVTLGFLGYGYYANNNVGVDLPEAPALFETSLSAPISATATTIPLSSIIVRGGEELANYNCVTIDEGSSQAEFVCGTVSGSSLINASRGVSAKDGFTENSNLQFPHRRGASVKVTDFPIIQLLRSQNNGDEAFENVLKYASGVVPSGANEIADVGYVLSVVTGGSVSFDGLTVGATAGETLATSTLVYFKTSDQQWYKVDTDISTTTVGVLIGFTQGNGTDENSITGGVLLNGLDSNQSGLTAGATYYASTTAGAISTSASSLKIGVAKSTTELFFDSTFFNTPRLTENNTFSGVNTFTGINTFTETSITGHASTTIITYTAGTSTWTKKDGLEYIIIEVIGAGAGGTGADSDDTAGAGMGGASGAYLKKKILASSLSATHTVVVGAGGAVGTSGSSPTAGAAGGTSYFSGFATSTGGSAGGIDASVPVPGGTATGGDFSLNGEKSGSGSLASGPDKVNITKGGDTPYGRGGYASVNGGNAVASTGYGAGGAGAYEYSNGTYTTSNAGRDGVVIVTEYY